MDAEFTRTVPADAERLPALLDAIEIWLTDSAVPMEHIARLMVAFDELLSNIVNHGDGTIELCISLANGSLAATIADDGPPFDPLARATPDLDLGIDQRKVGGLGIHLVREMMDGLAYAYENGRNLLKLTKTL
jgi:serine/threonine-protein kinase RsbW